MSKNIDPTAVFKLSYGLFVLTARDGDKDNGCIINTCTQLTSEPLTVSVCVNKSNLTHDMILKTGVFNVSVLTEETPFETFTFFGFQSGRDVDKFKFDGAYSRSTNGLYYLRYFANKTQTEIGRELGISQVQVSRMEKKILENMRNKMVE